MSLLQWYLVALGLIILWILVEYVIWKSKYYAKMERFNLSFYGPFLMWRTKRGRDIIERVSKKTRFCNFFGNISLVIVGAAMVTMTVTLMWVATLVIRIPEARQIEPHMLLGLPGLNPLIPLWYGIFGLVIAIIVHEFSHGIMARHADVKVLSLGLTFWIIPMGAFMEPDEEKIMKIDAGPRTRMFAVGPSSNLIIAGVCALIFSGLLMSAVAPVHEGVGITSVDGTFNFDDIEFATPARNISLEEGMVITSFNGTAITGSDDFTSALNKTTANQTVDIEYISDGQLIQKNVTLAYKGYYLMSEWGDKYDENLEKGIDYYLEYYDMGDTAENRTKYYDLTLNKGYLGVGSMDTTTAIYHPFEGAEEQGGLVRSLVLYVTLPLQRLSPISEPTSDFYEITGPLSAIPEPIFWVVANCFYWVFWLNLMVGLTNALPAVPLDGGYIFKDWLTGIAKKVKPDITEERITKMVDSAVWLMAFTILFLILWQIIGPRIM